MTTKARARIYVSGVVQGVFFRTRTAVMAYRLNVRGWVRNLSDGRVEAVFEGEKGDVDEMLEFCRRGPAGSVVKGARITWEDYKGEFTEFTIEH